MNGCKSLHGFKLDDEAFLNQEIQTRFAAGFSLIGHAAWHLPSKAHAAQHELGAECLFVHRLEKTGTE